MIAIQYEPIKEIFRIENGHEILIWRIWRNLNWVRTVFANRGFPYDWQIVIDNPQQKFYL